MLIPNLFVPDSSSEGRLVPGLPGTGLGLGARSGGGEAVAGTWPALWQIGASH